MAGPDWKLTKRKDACTLCERGFEENEPFFSLLAFDTEEVAREDVCRACFPARSEAGGDRLIFWRSCHRVGKKAVSVDFEALEGLFVALEGREEVELRELRYLLALLLMRKKRVKLVKTARRDDGEAMILRRPRRTEEQLCVYVFDLTPERAEALRGKLRAIFEGADLDELSAAAPASGAEEGEAEAEADADGDAEPSGGADAPAGDASAGEAPAAEASPSEADAPADGVVKATPAE